MGAAPRKRTMPLSPDNSRALMRANHLANLYSGLLRHTARLLALFRRPTQTLLQRLCRVCSRPAVDAGWGVGRCLTTLACPSAINSCIRRGSQQGTMRLSSGSCQRTLPQPCVDGADWHGLRPVAQTPSTRIRLALNSATKRPSCRVALICFVSTKIVSELEGEGFAITVPSKVMDSTPPPPQMWSRCFVHAKCRLLFLTIASYELRHSFLTKWPHHFGLTRQYAEAKTEAILALCGKGRQPAFERLVATEDPKIKVPTIAIGPGTALRIAPRNHQVGAIVVFKAQVPNIPHIGALSLPREKGH